MSFSDLARAACEDDLAHIAGADPELVNVVDESDKTALFYALYRSGATTDDDPSTVEALLQLGADPNQPVKRRDGSHRSPLHQAAIRSLSRVARALVDAGANLEEPGLMHAAAEGALVWLVERCLGTTPVDALHAGVTTLHDACYSGSLELVELLLDRGANPQARVLEGAFEGFDTLQFAIIGNNAAAVQRMIDARVTPTLDHLRFALDYDRTWAPPREEMEDAILDVLGATLEPWANDAPIRGIVRVLQAHLDDDACRKVAMEAAEAKIAATLSEACRSPDAEARVRFWVERFGPVPHLDALDAADPAAEPPSRTARPDVADLTTPQLRAALYEAARDGDADTLRALCRFADPNLAASGTAETIAAPPIYVAAKHRHLNAVRALLECGADPSRRAADNKTAYHVADLETRRLLRKARS